MIENEFYKDPNAILDYVVDWSEWLGDDTIASSDWTVPTGLTEQSHTNSTTTSTLWLSGGTDGCTYECINRIITTGGRTDDRTIYIIVKDK